MTDATPTRRRLWPALIVAAIVVVLLATRIATFYTEVLWFDSVGYSDVFWTVLGTRIGVGLAAGLVVAIAIVGNLLLARRLAPAYRIPSAQEESVERYRQLLEPFTRPLALGIAAIVGLLTGLSMSAEWETILLWMNRVPFDRVDPQFGRDIGYFVFTLPAFELINSWLFTTLILVTILSAVAHYVFGGIRPQSPGQRILPATVVHLSLLLAALVAVRAWGFVLDRHLLSYSERGVGTGLGYTDVNAQLLAYQLLAIISAVVVVLFLVNMRFRSWVLPTGGLALLLVSAVVLSGIYPAVIQRVQVDPQELPREREFIERNLEETRWAFGIPLDEVDRVRFGAESELSAEEVSDNSTTLESIRLWDPATLQNTYQQLQVFRPYYDFRDVDVDRYQIDGELQQVMIAVRELNENDIPEAARTWQNQRLLYTHGYGVVSSDVSIARDDGQPVFLQSDIPPSGVEDLDVGQPRIYFGEVSPEYSIVDTSIDEFDYPLEGGGQESHRYAGADGVNVGSIGHRLAFALRYAEPNFLLSGLIEPESKVIYNRNVRERVEAVAPYLAIDHDPYPTVVGDRVKWIVDAYTTTDMIPYSQRLNLGPVTAADQPVFRPTQNEQGEIVLTEQIEQIDGITGTANYIRNSVKAVVDAYDGTVELYAMEEEDPLLDAWQQIFPGTYTEVADADPELVAHFRYPEDMFRVQSRMFERYHIPEPDDFYSGEDNWATPIDAAYAQNLSSGTAEGSGQDRQERSMRPYYLLMRLPGESEEEFALIQPFTPAARPNLIGWLAGRSDGDAYGQLRAYLMPPDRTVFGPQQVQARIDQDNEVAQQITLWNQSGARVIYGNLLVIPVEDSLLYVQPLFLRAEQSDIPELAKSVLVFGNRIVMEDTLAEGLAALFGDAAPSVAEIQGLDPEEQPSDAQPAPSDDETLDPRVQQLIFSALEAYAEGEEALRDGDLAAYADANRRAQDLLAEAQELTGGEVPEFPASADEQAGDDDGDGLADDLDPDTLDPESPGDDPVASPSPRPAG